MLLARAAAEAGQLDQAKAELEFVLASDAADEPMKQLAQLRLARVAMAQGDFAAAESALAVVNSAEFVSLKSELSGDLAFAKGDLDAARAAYSEAIESADPQSRSLIQLKLDDIAAGDAS